MLTKFLRAAAGAGGELVFVGLDADSTDQPTSTPSFSLTSLNNGIASAPSIGDIVIACIAFKDGTDRNITCTTAGYTEVADLFRSDTNSINFAVYYKVLTAADTTVAFNTGVSVNSRFAVHVWRGQSATPLDATTTTTTSANTGVPNSPSITTVTNNAVVIAVGAAAGGTSGQASQLVNLTSPSGMINFRQTTSLAISVGIGIASIARPTAGAYDPPTFGGGNSDAANSMAACTIALRPK
jgi:hypothetical protein